MGDWDRKNADVLSDALGNHLRDCQATHGKHVLLTEIYEDSRRAATTSLTNGEALRQLRMRVCAVCRESGMCVCDVVTVWSVDCAFIKSKT